METIKPLALPPGGTIGITAMSSQIDAQATGTYIALIESLGYNVIAGKTITNIYDDGYVAATPEFRGKEFNQMVKDDRIDAIVAAAGGYGAQELAPYIDYDAVYAARKPIMGFSDTTFVLNAITSVTGLITFLGPTGETYDVKNDEEDIKASLAMISGEGKYPSVIQNPSRKIIRRLVPKRTSAEGVLLGGNLAMTECLIGTPWDIRGKFDKAIYLFEEVGESSYEISRIFLHIIQSGMFDNAGGFVFGDFSAIMHEDIETPYDSVPSIYESLRAYLASLDKPALVGYDFSHGERIITWPIGAKALIDSDARTVVILENPVAI